MKKVIEGAIKQLKLKNFSKKFGEGTAWDLDYGKLLIIGLLVYHIFIQ